MIYYTVAMSVVFGGCIGHNQYALAGFTFSVMIGTCLSTIWSSQGERNAD